MPSLSTQTEVSVHEYVPLVDADEDEDSENKSEMISEMISLGASKNFRISGLAVGVLVGFLVQMTTLGTNVVILEIWGDSFIKKSRGDIVLFSLIWSFVTSALAILMLFFLRALVSNFFRSLPLKESMRDSSESILQKMIENLELLFVIGALVGVSVAWVATDMFLGMRPQVNFSLVALGISLVWCRGVLWYRSFCESEDRQTVEDKEEEDQTNNYGTYTAVIV